MLRATDGLPTDAQRAVRAPVRAEDPARHCFGFVVSRFSASADPERVRRQA
ncbi:hypothetical protein [Frankia sp. CiP1_Cm_nod1]|uniref:hypothetical protein n=1 Tax=Frankia sp. CiP1_Cm_nod1 TaxID=2897160 RepID=UPI0020251451